MTEAKMTEAMKKINDKRDSLNKGRAKFYAKDYSCVVYVYLDTKGVPCATGYKGRQMKPAINYMYSSEEKRAESIFKWMKNIQEQKAKEKNSSKRELLEGDILRCSWGYEQTNIDYYLVTKLIGKTMVELVEIGYADREETGYMQGYCIPDENKILGEPMRKKAQGQCVSISSFQWARKIEPEIVAGAKIYKADHWTSYH